MKHAGAAALEELDALIAQLRTRDGLVERKLGIFYRKSKSYLHFHEDPAGLFADLRVDESFHRFPVNTPKQQRALLRVLDQALSANPTKPR